MANIKSLHQIVSASRKSCTQIFILFLIWLYLSPCHAQQSVNWDRLAQVTWQESFDATLGINIIEGKYTDDLLELDGQEVIISGYVIPLDALGLSYALSRTSFASCFFCGQAGPETVTELRVIPRSIEVGRLKNTLIKFQGRLQIRATNTDGLHFSLLDAKEIVE